MLKSSMRLVPCLAVLASVGIAQAQEVSAGEKLRAQNEKLRSELKAKDAEIARLKTQLAAKAAKAANANKAQKIFNVDIVRQAALGQPQVLNRAVKPLNRLNLNVQPVQVGNRLQQVVWLNNGQVNFGSVPTNNLMKGDYKKALDDLAAKRSKLDGIDDPVAARKVVDAMSRQLLDVRRALWELEQKARKAGAKKSDARKGR